MKDKASLGSDYNGKIAKEFRRIVCPCTLQDSGVWHYSASRILKFIESDEYLLICPDNQVPEFTDLTPLGWRIAGESQFVSRIEQERINKSAVVANKQRGGWLFQQFLKINAVIDPLLRDNDLVLIWDSDTVPLGKIRFKNSNGKIEYYYSLENHQPYFQTIQKLLRLEKSAEFSFVAQCFPTKVRWAREVVSAIAGTGSRSYIQTVLESLPGLESSEFSEYETMGVWNYENYPESVTFKKKNNWKRNGAEFLGSDLKGPLIGLFLFIFSLRFDFVSFEKWQKKIAPSRLFVRFLKNIFKKIPGKTRVPPASGIT